MCLLEKADTAGDAEWNVSPRQFELQLEGVKVLQVKHRHVVNLPTFFA